MNSRHLMIRASAGSGKTYALTNRFVQLLAEGAPPERVVALTFTRKAAGEFFDEILKKLADAAENAAVARKLAGEIGQPQFGRADFVHLLRRVIESMARLRLGTLDGFFARIARSFPLELGLAGAFELLEGHTAQMQRERVLQRIFSCGTGLDAAQKEFVEAFKRATFGREEKKLGAQLDAFLDEHQENYLAVPDAEFWGNPRRIWPAGNRWLGTTANYRSAVAALQRWLETNRPPEKQRQRWQDFLSAIETWRPGAPAPRPLEYVMEKAIAAWDELAAGRAVLLFDRKAQELAGEAALALTSLTAHVVGGELARHLEITRGIHAVLRGYEAVYDARVRREGKLTFADVQRLLLPKGGRVLSGKSEAAEQRMFLDYRLDGQIDHWLLDEFQDTSAAQWSILRNLIDEAVQDPEGRRTFFCVGDVKQAIFTWRGGDPRLFQAVLDHYNRMAPGTVVEDILVDSWRSGPAVIEMVNRVFGDVAAIRTLFAPAVAEAWQREWTDHRSAMPQRSGQAALLYGDDEAGRWERMVDVLREIRPLERQLTCVVLVQKNSTAARIADFLRKADIPALAESDLLVCTDNPVGAALLALIQAAFHPGDRLAWQHVGMTPFRAILLREGIAGAGDLAQTVLPQIHAWGFEWTTDHWLSRLTELETASFSTLRARQLVEAARIFDQSGSRDGDEFLAFMGRYSVRDSADTAAVRVMTMHKSKGLGFDVVMLPDLEGRKLEQRRKGLAMRRNAAGEVDWILDLPSELFRGGDSVLSGYVSEAEAEAGYSALSLLYVALTRAKRAMYAIVEPPKGSSSLNFPRILAETVGDELRSIKIGSRNLAGAWSSGEGDWFEPFGTKEVNAGGRQPLMVKADLADIPRVQRLPARRPSEQKPNLGRVLPLLGLGKNNGREFGSEVHALLAEVEWLDQGTSRHWATRWGGAGASPDGIVAALAALDTEALREQWVRRSEGNRQEVWRERAFELVLDGRWYTGVFDRVLVRFDQGGRVQSGWVVDFKTDRLVGDDAGTKAVQRHGAQLALYRRVAAILLGLPLGAVRASLVMLDGTAAKVVDLDAE